MAIASADAGRPDLFISYAREDIAFVQKLDAALEARGKNVWVDWEAIRPSADWRAKVFAGIEGSKAFVAVLSPELIASEVCRDELKYAVEQNKRIVPILRREVDRGAAPAELTTPNWIFFRDGDDFDRSLGDLAEAVETDLEWLDAHARLLVRAKEWEAEGRDKSFLLRGRDLGEAESWLARQGSHDEAATGLQAEYVLESRKAAAFRRRAVSGATFLALAITGALAVFALIQRNGAIAEAKVARSRELATSALSQLAADPQLGLLLAQEAVNVRETPQAVDALRRALTAVPARTVLHHGGMLRSAVFSPDGTLVATASADGTTKLWRSSDGQQLAVLRHHAAVNSVNFSPNSRLVVTASDDGTAAVWQVSSGRRIATLRHRGAVRTAVFGPRGGIVLTSGQDGTARLWRVRHASQLAVLRTPRPLSSAVLSGDGRFALTVGARYGPGYAPRLWNVTHRRLLRVLPVEYTSFAAFSPDSKLLLIEGKGQASASVVQVPSGKIVSSQVTDACCGSVVSAAFSPDGKTVATANPDIDQVLLWKTAKGYSEAYGGSVVGMEAPKVTAVSFSDDGRLVLAASSDGKTRWWRTDGRLVAVVHQAGSTTAAAFAPGGAGVVTAGAGGTAVVWTSRDPLFGPLLAEHPGPGPLDFDPGTRSALFVAADGIHIVDVRTGMQRALLKNEGATTSAQFSPDGRLVLTQASLGAAHIWDASTGKKLGTLPGEANANTNTWSYGGDGKVVVRVFDENGGVNPSYSTTVFDASTRRRIASFSGLEDAFEAYVSQDAKRILTIDKDRVARLRRTIGGALVAVLRNRGTVYIAGFTPHGLFAYTSGSNETRLFAPATGRELLRLPGTYAASSADDRVVATLTGSVAQLWGTTNGHEKTRIPGVTHLIFSTDGKLFATGGASTRVWRFADRHLLATLPTKGSLASPEAFSSDDRLLLTSSERAPPSIWDAQTGSQIAVLPPHFLGRTPDFSVFVGWNANPGSLRSYVCDVCLPLPRLLLLAHASLLRTLTPNERETFLHRS